MRLPRWTPVAITLAVVVPLLGWLVYTGAQAFHGHRAAAVTIAVSSAAPVLATPAPTVSPSLRPVMPSTQASPTPAVTPILPSGGTDQAAATASSFVVAYASYSYADAPDAVRVRVRPFDTDALDARLVSGAGSGDAGAQLAARHEIGTASVQRLDTTGLTPDGRLLMVATVVVNVKSDQGTSSRTAVYELWMAHAPAGWRVDQVSST